MRPTTSWTTWASNNTTWAMNDIKVFVLLNTS